VKMSGRRSSISSDLSIRAQRWGDLPTPTPPHKKTSPAPASQENDTIEADEAVPDNDEHSEDKFEDPETVEIRGNTTEEAHDVQEVKADKDRDAQEVKAHHNPELARKSAGEDYDPL
jgi:hypothetical protein